MINLVLAYWLEANMVSDSGLLWYSMLILYFLAIPALLLNNPACWPSNSAHSTQTQSRTEQSLASAFTDQLKSFCDILWFEVGCAKSRPWSHLTSEQKESTITTEHTKLLQQFNKISIIEGSFHVTLNT